jgi:amino acid adenylation domain-containing protein
MSADRQGLRNLVRELKEEYEGKAIDAQLQYTQYSEWQRELLSEIGEVEESYWRERTPEEYEEPPLPWESARKDATAFSVGRVRVADETGEIKKLAEMARAEGASEEVTLLAAWAALLWRLSGNEDRLLGYALDASGDEVLRTAIGMFTKWTPVRLRIEKWMSLRDVIALAAKEVEGLREWGEYFQSEKVEGIWSCPGATYEYGECVEEETGVILSFKIVEERAEFDRYKVKLRCEKKGDRIDAEISFDETFFVESDARKLGAAYVELLKSAAEGFDRRVVELDYLSEGERRELFEAFDRAPDSDSWADPDRDCIHTLFSAQAAGRPDAVAMVDEWQSLSYRELDLRSSQLAGRLAESGVGPGDVVGLMLERGVEMVVSLLGILKAGGAYLPIDPQTPVARADYMLKGGRARALITRSGLLKDAALGGSEIVLLDQDREGTWRGDPKWSGVSVEPEQPAYVIYTSGSTGEPKGVVVEHRQLVNYVRAVTRRVGLEGGKRYAVVTTLSADLGNTMIYPSLLLGGELHVVSVERARDGRRLGEYMEREGIEYLKVTPSHLEMVMNTSGGVKGLPREKLIFGGEALSEELARRVREEGECEIYNHYGPTETTVGVMAGEVRRGEVVALGRALSDVRAYVMDEGLKVTGKGLKGEICIGGAGVSRGYVGRADVTAEKFVPDPYGLQAGARMYRTGDQGRALPDGRIDFLGRRDNQVKYHGFRVELDELRAALNSLEKVRDSVIKTLRDEKGRDVLVAFYVSRHEIEPSEIRKHLLEIIPEETIPSLFVWLKRFPLTLNGKINHQSLPQLDEIRKMCRRTGLAPRNHAETTIARIWGEILGGETISVEDSFFELGGHSLLAALVISRMQEEFKVELPLRALFEHPTIAELAEELARLSDQRHTQQVIATNSPAITKSNKSMSEQVDEIGSLSENEVRALLELESR